MPRFTALPLAVFAVLAAVRLCRTRCDTIEMPRAGGSDAVAVLFGDVRMLIGRRMIGKADEYFHGGVTELNCSLEHHHHDHGHAHDDGDDLDHGHNGEDGEDGQDLKDHAHDDHEEGEGEHHEVRPVRSPWAFVTHAIRLPSIERHLEGQSTREMLPWLWAACRVDSGNVNAYANAAYVLESLYGDRAKALAVLDDGIAANPASSELEFQKGLLLLKGKTPGKAEAAFAAALAKVPRDRHLENREDTDATMLALRTLAMLGRLAADRGDGAALRKWYEKARAIAPGHPATKSLGQLVAERAD